MSSHQEAPLGNNGRRLTQPPPPRPLEIGQFSGSISNIKLAKLSATEVAIACSALSTPSGAMYNASAEPKKYSSERVYTSLYARHWDTWVTDNTNSVWYGLLKKTERSWALQKPGLVNALAGTKLESPVPPFGGTGDFDVGPSGIVFVARDPKLSLAVYTKTDLYYVPLKSFTDPKPPLPRMVQTGKLRGYTVAPVFSHDGKKVAFARMRDMQYETDKTRVMLLPDISDLANVQEFYATRDGDGGWDVAPEWIIWSNDDKELYMGAEDEGKVKLWKMPSTPLEAVSLPESIPLDGSVVDARPLGSTGGRLFVSLTSRIESSCFSIVDPGDKTTEIVSSSSKHGKSFGLSRSQCDEFWYKGVEGYDIHALVTKPSNFDPSKKYPLAFLIHGGPQNAWLDSWSTRWNSAIFAEQGYIAVMPNPTGSSGYGSAHKDKIRDEWGGKPYEDLVKCFEHMEKNIPYIDTGRAVALGASYGGYMISKYRSLPNIPN
jgi:dipeptidyl aminopeptidase/acylaminoacyl peptidase